MDTVKESEIGRKPGLVNRRKVFLSGGAPWAIATLTDPAGMLDDNPCMKFRLEDLRKFHKAVQETGQIPLPDLSRLPEPIRKQAEEQINAVLNTFTPENLLAGSEILLAFDERCAGKPGTRTSTSPSPASSRGLWALWARSTRSERDSPHIPGDAKAEVLSLLRSRELAADRGSDQRRGAVPGATPMDMEEVASGLP